MRYAPLTLTLALAATSAARAAAEPTETDRSLAQSLFEQGKALLDAGKYDEACPKLEESQKLDPGGGTLMNLALCHEKQGKVATAWADFKTALSLARRDGRQDRAAAAEEHIAALEPKLPKLTVTVPHAVAGESVSIDGGAVGAAGWGVAVSVDPGSHEIAATAPGKQRWKTTITIALSEQKSFSVPALEAGEARTTTESSTPTTAEGGTGNGQRTAGFLIGGFGVVGIGLGTYFGVQALSKRHRSDDLCPTDTTCSAEGVSLNDQAKTAAWVANFGVGLGIVGVAVGGYLLLTADDTPKHEHGRAARSRVAFDADAGPNGGRLTLRGVW